MVMVSLYPNPPADEFYVDSMMKMGLHGLDPHSISSSNATTVNANANSNSNSNSNSNGFWSMEDPNNKKVRKPYTITKSRESWAEEEHDKFLEALQLFDRDWKKIEAFVGSKTVIQIRSHAQKHFLKVQKNGTGEHVPPPRPKRKAARPYPQKASKHAPVMSLITGPLQSGSLLEPGYFLKPESLSQSRNPIGNPTLSSWTPNIAPPVNVSHVTTDEVGVTRPVMAHNCCSSSSNESTQGTWPNGGTNDQGEGKFSNPVRAMPDFAKVYSFIGSVFDPNASGHLQRLKNMDPINVETILLLMRNLSVNLISSECEDHRRLLPLYDIDSEKANYNDLCNNLHISKPENAIPMV